jgi:PKD repeat protein
MTDRSTCVRRFSQVAAAPVFAGRSRTFLRAAVALFLAAVAVTGRGVEASEGMLANPDHVEVVLGPMAILVDVQANDVNHSGEPWRTVIEDHPPVGSVVVHWDGSVTYSLDHQPPDRSWVSFSYYLEDRLGRKSSVAEVCIGSCTLSILVAANDDTATVELGRSVAIDALVNDVGDGKRIVSAAVNVSFDSDNGSSVVLQSNGTFLYTPTKLGTDWFPYTIEDVYGERSTATVAVTVVPPAGVAMAEVGVRHNVTHEWTTVQLQRTYARPVVIAKPAGVAGPVPGEVRLTDVTSNSFKMRIQGIPCPAFGGFESHPGEMVAYLVVEAGSWEIAPGFRLDAGVVESDVTVTGQSGGRPTYASATTSMLSRRINFSEGFRNTAGVLTPPAVLTHVQTINDPSYVLTRQEVATAHNLLVGLQKEEEKQRAGVLHGAREQVGWIAVTPGVGEWSGRAFQAARVLDCPGYCTGFFADNIFGARPALLAGIASLADLDPATLRVNDEPLEDEPPTEFTAEKYALVMFEDLSYDGLTQCDGSPWPSPRPDDEGHGNEDIAFLAVAAPAQGAAVLQAIRTLNLPPVALDQTVTVRQDEMVLIGPKAVDPEGRFGCLAALDTTGLVGTLESWPAPDIPCGVEYSPPAGWSGRTELRASVHDSHGGPNTGLESPNLAKITIDVLPLTASFTKSCAWRTCTFTSTSTPDATSFTWSFGDGSFATGQQVVRTYTKGGNFVVRLTVTNSHGRTHFAEEVVGLPPSASFTVDSCPNRTCTFTSTSTSDATSFLWNFGDGSPTTPPSSAKTITKTYTNGGRYVVSLTARNGVPLSDLNVKLVDLPPTVSFTVDNCPGRVCTFTATSTADATSFQWSFGDGSPTTAATSATITKTYTEGGRYVVSLTATNDVALSAASSLTLDLPPTASFTVDSCPGRTCTFTSTSTADATSFQWNFGDGSPTTAPSSAATITKTFARGGRFVVSLTATNEVPLSAVSTLTLDLPPTASFIATCEGAICELDAGGSSADASSFTWSLPGGTTLLGKKVSHNFVTSGGHEVTLTVSNGSMSATQTQTVFIDLPPIAAFTFACDDLDCRFDASASSDDLGIVSYAWSFGDGSDGSGVTPQHSFADDGLYSVTLTVCDGKPQCSSKTTTVDVFDLTLLLLILE